MENRILIKNRCRLALDQEMLRRKLGEILGNHGYHENTELSVVLMGKKWGQKLNQQYRHKRYIPQMLEFPLSQKADEDGYVRLGDILICVAKFRDEMKQFGKSEEAVLTEWLEHGIGNLLQ